MADALPGASLQIIHEEEALLLKVLSVLSAAQARAAQAPVHHGLRSVAELRALRDEAASASEDDLPALFLEMSVRHKLLEHPAAAALPDLGSPYLAHLRVRDERGPKDYLLGHVSFVDPAADVRLVDWRVAPIAGIFYRYREGDDYDEVFPGREVEGRVEVRRIVVIQGGSLAQIVGDDIVLERLPDGHWAHQPRAAWSFRAGGAGTAARPGVDVTALLDERQFEAMSAPAEQPLLVLGSAGSGKTTVALHRLARIAATDPARYPLSSMQLVVPEEGLARLSKRILEPIARGSVPVYTLDAWSHALARAVFGKEMPRRCVEAPALVSSLKRSPAFYDALRAHFARRKLLRFKPTRQRLAELYTDRPFLDQVVAASGGTLSRASVDETIRHTLLQLAEPMERVLSTITDPSMKNAVDGRPIAEGTPDDLAGTVDLDDLSIGLFLRAWQSGLDVPSLAHLVLDETEDFSLFELFVLGTGFGETRSVTLAGDEAQQTLSSFAGWERALATVGAHDATVCRLAVSYRCPHPVVEVAQQILGALAHDRSSKAAREGAPVGVFAFPDEARAHLFLSGALRDLADREPHASIGVIAHNATAARTFHRLIAAPLRARLVLDGGFSFAPGIDVTDVDTTKGLEFDYVVIPDAVASVYPATDEARRRLHVAVTRTSHQLWLVSGGPPSPLLSIADPRAAPSR